MTETIATRYQQVDQGEKDRIVNELRVTTAGIATMPAKALRVAWAPRQQVLIASPSRTVPPAGAG